MTLEYRQSLKEVNTILNCMGEEYINKLPKKLILFIKENMDNSYVSNINVNTPINMQLIKNDTKVLLSLIYRNYWCSEDKKAELIAKDAYLNSKYEKELKEKYNPDNLFKNRVLSRENTNTKSVSIVAYKESIFKRLLTKLKTFFNIN